jgi:hypothetical protein
MPATAQLFLRKPLRVNITIGAKIFMQVAKFLVDKKKKILGDELSVSST